jgi:hypothetical protein
VVRKRTHNLQGGSPKMKENTNSRNMDMEQVLTKKSPKPASFRNIPKKTIARHVTQRIQHLYDKEPEVSEKNMEMEDTPVLAPLDYRRALHGIIKDIRSNSPLHINFEKVEF